MEEISYIQIDTWKITVIIVLLIITMVSMLILMAYFYFTTRPLREVKPSNNNQQSKKGRGRPRKVLEPSREGSIPKEDIRAAVVKVKEDRLVKAVKSVPLPHKPDLQKLKDVKLTKPKQPESWMSELEVSDTDQ